MNKMKSNDKVYEWENSEFSGSMHGTVWLVYISWEMHLPWARKNGSTIKLWQQKYKCEVHVSNLKFYITSCIIQLGQVLFFRFQPIMLIQEMVYQVHVFWFHLLSYLMHWAIRNTTRPLLSGWGIASEIFVLIQLWVWRFTCWSALFDEGATMSIYKQHNTS